MDKPLGDYTYSPSFLSIPSPQPTPRGGCGYGIRKDVLMTATCWSWTGGRKELFVQQLRYADLTAHAQAFGHEPNALTKLCNCLIQKNFGSPG